MCGGRGVWGGAHHLSNFKFFLLFLPLISDLFFKTFSDLFNVLGNLIHHVRYNYNQPVWILVSGITLMYPKFGHPFPKLVCIGSALHIKGFR